jgi:hypothetical protein
VLSVTPAAAVFSHFRFVKRVIFLTF